MTMCRDAANPASSPCQSKDGGQPYLEKGRLYRARQNSLAGRGLTVTQNWISVCVCLWVCCSMLPQMITDTFLSNSSSSHFYKNMHSEVSLIGQHTQSHVGINLLSLSLMNIIMKHFRTSRPCVFIFSLLCFGG